MVPPDQTSSEFSIRNRIFFYAIFAALIILSLMVVKPFLNVLALSIISVIMLKPLYNYLLKTLWAKGRQRLAASASLFLFLLLLVTPILLIGYLVIAQLSNLLEQIGEYDLGLLLQNTDRLLSKLSPALEKGIIDENQVAEGMQALARATAGALADILLKIGSSLPSLLMQGMIFLVVVVTLMPVYDTLVEHFESISPLGSELSELYYRKTTAMVSSLVKGVFLIAIIQGFVMGIFFHLAGVSYSFLLALLSMIFAMLPLVGISYIALVVAFVLAISGNAWGAVIVLFGFYGVVNWIDIILRPRLISKEAYMNFALVLLGILGGLLWAGLLGLIYGPVIILLLVTTIDIYAERFAHEDSVILRSMLRGRNDEPPKGDNEEQKRI